MSKVTKEPVSKSKEVARDTLLDERTIEVMTARRVTRAIGMIETRGIVAAIEASDAMLKTADVTLVKMEKIGSGLVTMLIEGDISAVREAVEVGQRVATEFGELIASHVIPKPYLDIRNL